jgi:hypothetical protein
MRRLALASLAAVLLIALHVAPLPGHNRLWWALSDALHAPGFALVAIFAMAAMPAIGRLDPMRSRRRWPGGATPTRYAAAFVVTMVIASLAEWSQTIGPRTESLADWLRDALGAAAGLALHALFGRRARDATGAGRALVWTGRLAIIAVLATGFVPVAQWGHAYLRREAAFPVLGAFEAGWETLLWRPRGGSLDLVAPPPGWPREGTRVARIQLEPGRYPGVSLAEPHADWTGYEALELSLFSPEPEPITLWLRIHDAEHENAYADRYNTRFEVVPGQQTLRIPLENVRKAPRERELDLSRVAGLALFLAGLEEPRTLYLDDVRLVAPEKSGAGEPAGRRRRE